MASSYACPGCGAPMEFDAASQKMLCSHCGTSCTVEELENILEHVEKHEDAVEGDFGEDDSKVDFKVYRCPSCGAELLTDENTASTFCSFCGTPTLVEDRLQGEKRPSQVIPFKIKKDAAKEMYIAWAKKGKLTPSGFSKESTIEKITGMYVPFWLYDYDAEMSMTAKCTKVFHERHGDYEYTHTDHYMVTRDVETEYDKVPADAAEKMPDDIMDKLEPFAYSDLTDFDMPYLSGYYAEKFNYTAQDLAERIEKRIRKYIYDATRSTIVGYNTVDVVNQNTRMQRKGAKYVLMPVWILNYRYKDKDYMFALNGQSGRIVADRPTSAGKAAAWFGGVTAAVFIISMIVGLFL